MVALWSRRSGASMVSTLPARVADELGLQSTNSAPRTEISLLTKSSLGFLRITPSEFGLSVLRCSRQPRTSHHLTRFATLQPTTEVAGCP